MKKVLMILIVIALALSVGCSDKKVNEATEDVVSDEASSEAITPNSVDENSPEAAEVKRAAARMLDTFISADFDAIRDVLQDDDENYFNFDSEDQIEFYSTIFPMISYDFSFVSEYEGVYGVMTTITSPNMADVYGQILVDIMETDPENAPTENMRDIITKRMQEVLTSSTQSAKRTQDLYIYVEHKDGKYIPRCDAYLANELTGGAIEASSEISGTVLDTVNSLYEAEDN